MEDDELHIYAREIAEELQEPDKKQLRYNSIVQVSKLVYNDNKEGVKELVLSCDKTNLTLYIKKQPMWEVLMNDYSWMFEI